MEETRFECAHCGESYPSVSELSEHDCNGPSISTPRKDVSPSQAPSKKSIMKCGLCDYVTENVTGLIEHTTQHAIQRHPFKCIQCKETFPSYPDLQKHPCGDTKFVFLLNLTTPHKQNKNEDKPAEDIVDLSNTSRKRSGQHTDIVSGTRAAKITKTDNEGMNGISDGSKKESSTESPVYNSPMILRTRRSRSYTNMITDKQFDDELECEKDLKPKPVVIKSKSGKSNKVPVKGKKAINQYNTLQYCEYCNFSSYYPGNLSSHIKRHYTPAKNHYQCKRCGLYFLSPRSQQVHKCKGNKRHVTITERNQPTTLNISYICRLCGFRTALKCNLTKHVYRHRCATCREYFPTVTKCTAHMLRCRKAPVVYSQDVHQTKTSEGKIISFHRKSPSSLSAVHCTLCKTNFQNFPDFQCHTCHKKKTNTGNVKHKVVKGKMEGYDPELMMYCCKYCIFTSPSALALINHVKHKDTEHPLEKTQELQIKRLKYAQEKERHRKKPRMQGWDDKTMLYLCDICNFATPTAIALYNHKKYHVLPEEPVELSAEENGSEDSEDQASEPEKVYSCSTCDFTAVKLWQLRAHEGLHTGKRPLKCNACNIGFSDSFHLNIHQLKCHDQETTEPTGDSRGSDEYCPQVGCNFKSTCTATLTRHCRSHFTNRNISGGPVGKHHVRPKCEVTNNPGDSLESEDMDVDNATSEHIGRHSAGGETFLPRSATNHDGDFSCDLSSIVERLEKGARLPEPSRTMDSLESQPEESDIEEVETIISYKCSACSFTTEKLLDLKVHKASHFNRQKMYSAYPEKGTEKPKPNMRDKSTNSTGIDKRYLAETQSMLLRYSGMERERSPVTSGVEQSSGGETGLETDDYNSPRLDLIGSSPELTKRRPFSGPPNASHVKNTYLPTNFNEAIDMTSRFRRVYEADAEMPELQQEEYPDQKKSSGDRNLVTPTSSHSIQCAAATSTAMPPPTPAAADVCEDVNSVDGSITWIRPPTPQSAGRLSHSLQGSRPGSPTPGHTAATPLGSSIGEASATPKCTTSDEKPTGSADMPRPESIQQIGSNRSHVAVPIPVHATTAPTLVPMTAISTGSRSGQGAMSGNMGAGGGAISVNLHRCGFCRIHFEDFRLFLHHLGMHHPENPWNCTFCWKNFSNVFSFHDHH